MGKQDHCVACGETVEAYEVDLGGATEVRCMQCGLPLEKRGAGVRFRRVLIADDAAFYTEGLSDFLVQRKLAGDVIKASDGVQAVEALTATLLDRKPVQVAIIDLLMPRLNGLHCAMALRAVERGFEAPPASLLFLSSKRLDPDMQPLLEELAPAYYLNKGGDRQGALADRLAGVLAGVATARRRNRGGDSVLT